MIFNSPSEARAVLQTFPSFSFIHSVSHPFSPIFQNIITPKQLELESLNLARMFTPHHVPCVMCHISCVTCHMSPVTCPISNVTFFSFFFITKLCWTRWWSQSVEGLLSTGSTPSSFSHTTHIEGHD